jgi:hypothetical protein
MFSRLVQFFCELFCFDWAQLWPLEAKLKFVFACFSHQNSSGFNSAKASGYHQQPAMFGPWAQDSMSLRCCTKNLKMFLQGLSCHIAVCVLEPKSEWKWTVASRWRSLLHIAGYGQCTRYVVYAVTWLVFWGCRFPVVSRHVTKSCDMLQMSRHIRPSCREKLAGNISIIDQNGFTFASFIGTRTGVRQRPPTLCGAKQFPELSIKLCCDGVWNIWGMESV